MLLGVIIMLKGLITKKEIENNADVFNVWKALISPELIKQYLLDTEVVSEWKINLKIMIILLMN